MAISLSVVVEGFQLGAGSLLTNRKGSKYSLTVAKYASAKKWHTMCACGSTSNIELKFDVSVTVHHHIYKQGRCTNLMQTILL